MITRALALLLFVALFGDATAQSTKRIAVLQFSADYARARSVWQQSFQRGLIELGHIPGKTVTLIEYTPKDHKARVGEVAQRAVASKPDVIFVSGTVATLAAAKATATIPIVFASVGDPVASGFTVSLARPSRNLTGVSNFSGGLSEKRLQLLKEILPHAKRVAALHSGDEASRIQLEGFRHAAARLGLEFFDLAASDTHDFKPSFGRLKQRGTDAIEVLGTSLFSAPRTQIAALAMEHQLPAISPFVTTSPMVA